MSYVKVVDYTLTFNPWDNKINRNWQSLLVHSCGLSKPFIISTEKYIWFHLAQCQRNNIHACAFFLLFVSSTLSLNKLHRITLTENSCLIRGRCCDRKQTGYFLLQSNGRLAFGKVKSFSRGSGQWEGRWWTRKVEWSVVGRHVGRRFEFLRDVHLLFVFFIVVSAVLALRWGEQRNTGLVSNTVVNNTATG